jgi:hypothetical protein
MRFAQSFFALCVWLLSAQGVAASTVSIYTVAAQLPLPLLGSVRQTVIPGPASSDSVTSVPPTWKTGAYTCPANAQRCTATIVGPGGAGSASSCGGGGAFATDIELAPSLSYNYELVPPAGPSQSPGFTSLFSAAGGTFIKQLAGSAGTASAGGAGGTGTGNYAVDTSPGRKYLGMNGALGGTCSGGASWSRGLFNTESTRVYAPGTSYPWGGGGSPNQLGGQGVILVSEFY